MLCASTICRRAPLTGLRIQSSVRARLAKSIRSPFQSYTVRSFKVSVTRHASEQRRKERDEHAAILETTSPKDLKTATAELRSNLKAQLAETTSHENIYNLPNFLTLTRLIATPAIGYLLLTDSYVWAVGLFAYAGITDLVDGWLARRWKLQTVVGSVIDPLADKSLMTVLTVCLAVKGLLPVSIATIILGRDVSLAIAAIYYRYASLPPPKTFMRYWDFSLPSAQVYPTQISKLNTLLQLVLIGATTAMPLVSGSSAIFPIASVASVPLTDMMFYAQCLVGGTTLWSGLSYLYTRDAVKVLREDLSDDAKRKIVRRGRGVLGLCFLGCLGVAVILES